ncbi:MAG: O-methyltransferase [Clostridia bacterium]|nr:O-methyltransferase [Clostridia bacterium]
MEKKMNEQELILIKKNALERHIPIIMDDTLEVIAEILNKVKPKRILEIGTAVGYSAMCFSKYVQEGGSIDTIERDEERIQEAKENFVKVGVEDKINLYEGDAVEILPTLSGIYDVIFIDAAKGKYPFFLEQALRMISDNGVIIADNILYKGYVMSDYNKHKQRTAVRNLREYIAKVNENANLDTEILEVGDGLAVSYKRH